MSGRPGWNGARVTAAVAHVVARDGGICWLCRHDGANSLDHVIPVKQDPTREWDPTNWKAAHLNQAGTPKGCQTPGCQCIGNTKRKDNPAQIPPSRSW